MNRKLIMGALSCAIFVTFCGKSNELTFSESNSIRGLSLKKTRYLMHSDTESVILNTFTKVAQARGVGSYQAKVRGLTTGVSDFGAKLYNNVNIVALELTDSEAEAVRQISGVKSLSTLKRVWATAEQSPVPSWGLDRIDQQSLPLNKKYTYPSSAGSSVHAYVIDTGIDKTHSEFVGRIGTGFNAVTKEAGAGFVQDTNAWQDCAGHGTHVSGTVAGSMYGVAKLAQIHAVRVLDCNGDGSDEDVISGINWVLEQKNKAPNTPMVANISLGGDPSDAFDAAVKALAVGGVFTAVASGNESGDACATSPSRELAVFTVSSTDKRDQISYFSNFGTCVDIYAPGENIISARLGGGSESMSGTSMASPHVAGVGALVLDQHPGWSHKQVSDYLLSTGLVSAVGGIGATLPENVLLQFISTTSDPQPDPTPRPRPNPSGGELVKDFLGQLTRDQVAEFVIETSDLPDQNMAITGILEGDDNTDFDLALFSWNDSTSKWQKLSVSETKTSHEEINFDGGKQKYKWVVTAYLGSGKFSLHTVFSPK